MSRENTKKLRQLRALFRNRCDQIVLSEEDVYVYSDLKDPDIFYCLTKGDKEAMQKTLEEEGYKEPILYDNKKCESLFIDYKKECSKAQFKFKGQLTILQQRNQFIKRNLISEDELRQLLFLLSNHDHIYNCFSGRKTYELFCLRSKQTDPGHQYIIDMNKYIYDIYQKIINLDDRYNKEVFRQLYYLFTKRRPNVEEIELKEGLKIFFSYLGFKFYQS